MLPPTLEIYVVWHPNDPAGQTAAQQFIEHFHGTAFSGLIGGAVIIEEIFSLPGMGQLYFTALETRDTPVMMGTTLLTAVVTCWVAGFDILYACQDMEHDRAAGLFSIPQALGLDAAFWISVLFHFGCAGRIGVIAVAILLLYEHMLVSPRDLRKLNAAFFTMNGVIATVFLIFVAADQWFAH